MKQLTCILFLIFMFLACSPRVNYLGKSYPSTTNLDIYFDRKDIPFAYETMGQGEADVIYPYSMQRAQESIEKYAKRKGADAIIFDGIGIITNPSVTVTEDKKKNNEGGYTVVSTTSTNNNETKIVRATFIKYK